MTSATIYQDLAQIVQKMMKKQGVTPYELKIEGHSEAGDNYLGEIIFFKIITENGTKIHEMVMKTAKRSEKLRESVPIEHVYNRELFMYSKVFPEFRKFLEEIDAKFALDFVPKLFWISEDPTRETLIFSNLKSEGFKLKDRKLPWNLEHSLFVMEHYGKFHAISLALKDQKPEIFDKLAENLSSLGSEFKKTMDLDTFYGVAFEKTMELLRANGKDDLVEKYKGFVQQVVEIGGGNSDPDDKIVITHGDCWNNNFMFRYKDDDETRPWKMCFLDFQISSLDTPIIDLSYNIFTSCDKSGLENLDLILETYYKSLTQHVKMLGTDPEVLFSYEKFKKHWKKYSKFGVLLSTIVTKILLTTKEEAPDLSKDSEEGKSLTETFDFVVENEDEYNRRVLEVFVFYGENYL